VAIAAGARGDDCRRRLRTYEAALAAIATDAAAPATRATTLVAANDD